MTRTPMTVAIWATGVFTVAGLGFQKLTEDPALTPVMDRHPAVVWSFRLLVIAAMIALAAIVVAALPTAGAMLRGHANGAWRYVPVPFVAFAVWYGILRLALLLAAHQPVHSARNLVAAAMVILAGFGVVALTAWATGTVLNRVQAPVPLRLERTTRLILAAAMAVATAACVVWGLALHAADPVRFTSHDGILASPFVPSWIVVTALMMAATALGVRAARPSVERGSAISGR